jgi:hypothetical protein
MPRPKQRQLAPKEDLHRLREDFCYEIVRDGRVAEATMRSYRSTLNGLIKKYDRRQAAWLTKDRVATIFQEYEQEYPPARVTQARAAWNLFREWMVSTHGYVLPLYPKRDRRGYGPVEMPPVIIEAIVNVLDALPPLRMPLGRFIKLRWRDIGSGEHEGVMGLFVPGPHGRFWHLPSGSPAFAGMQTLYRFATPEVGGEPDGTTPVIVRASGSAFAPPVSRVRIEVRLVKDGREAGGTEVDSGRLDDAARGLLSG